MRGMSLAGMGLAIAIAVGIACVGSDAAFDPDRNGGDGGGTNEAAAPVDSSASDGASSDAADAGPTSVVSVEAADVSGCALLSNGTVWCWGSNELGQVGVTPPGGVALPATEVAGLADVTSISTGGSSACAVKKDATVWCWGRNTRGELGHAPESDALCGADRCTPTPTQVPGVFAASVAVGWGTTCAVTTSKTVVCWGNNDFGQAGAAISTTPVGPTALPPFADVTKIKIGFLSTSTCAIASNKRLWCWGDNTYGQLGHAIGDGGDVPVDGGYSNATPAKVFMPSNVELDNVVDAVSAPTTCVVRGNGNAFCWGRNTGNELNLDAPDSLPHATPVQIEGISTATSIGYGNALCALLETGEPVCWGSGNVASGSTPYDGGCTNPLGVPNDCHAPAPVPGVPLATLDVDHLIAVGLTLDGGIAVAWGSNGNFGRLGHVPGTAGDDGGANPARTPILGLP